MRLFKCADSKPYLFWCRQVRRLCWVIDRIPGYVPDGEGGGAWQWHGAMWGTFNLGIVWKFEARFETHHHDLCPINNCNKSPRSECLCGAFDRGQ